jgi:hypothetical protein
MTESETKHDIDGLLRKNAELLGELKAAKARIAELESERDSARADAQVARDTMRRVQLEEPLEQALAGAFTVPWRIMRPLLGEHFTFELGDDGKPRVTAKATNEPVPLSGMIAAMATIPDLAAALRPPRGGNALGNDRGSSVPDVSQPKPKPKVPRRLVCANISPHCALPRGRVPMRQGRWAAPCHCPAGWSFIPETLMNEVAPCL